MSVGDEARNCLKLLVEGEISDSFEAAKIAVSEFDGRDISELSFSELEFMEKVTLVIQKKINLT